MNGLDVFVRSARACLCVALIAAMPGVATSADEGQGTTDLTLKGGESGTVFRSLTVEGESRIRIDIARPKLQLDLDPRSAPGLELSSIQSALGRDRPDRIGPLHAEVASRTSPHTARPWLNGFATGPVALFQPDVTDVDRWRLVVADSRGREVATFEGKGRPRKPIVWHGRGADGSIALPGLTYSYVFQAQDRAGNRRNFVGEGFAVPAYRRSGQEGASFVFSGTSPGLRGLGASAGAKGSATPPLLIEIASRLHQSIGVETPVRVHVVSRSYEAGDALARSVVTVLGDLLAGDAGRVVHTVDVASDAPAGGAVVVTADS